MDEKDSNQKVYCQELAKNHKYIFLGVFLRETAKRNEQESVKYSLSIHRIGTATVES